MAQLQEIKVPLLSVNDTSITVLEIPFPNGHAVKKGDIILVFETSKTTYDVATDTDGFVQYDCIAGEEYEVNETVANIFSEAAEAQKAPAQQKQIHIQKDVDSVVPATWEGETFFSVEANRLIESSGIKREIFNGKDFVSRHDVEEILGVTGKKQSSSSSTQTAAKQARVNIPVDHSKVIVEKLSSGKKREIEYLKEIQSAGLTSTIDIMVETDGIFFNINKSLRFLKNSILTVIIYEAGRLLKKYNLLNAYFTGETIAFYKNVNIGFAIDIDKGLKVLKIAEASEKSIHEIEAEIMGLSNRYLDDNLHIDDLTDITFTITDLSSEGVLSFRPLVNMMNSGILGISAIDEKLHRCILNLTFDHRVTEGKLVSQFLKELKERLESYRAQGHGSYMQEINCYKCMKSLKEDLGDVGFMKCITPAGEEGYICQSCLNGF